MADGHFLEASCTSTSSALVCELPLEQGIIEEKTILRKERDTVGDIDTTEKLLPEALNSSAHACGLPIEQEAVEEQTLWPKNMVTDGKTVELQSIEAPRPVAAASNMLTFSALACKLPPEQVEEVLQPCISAAENRVTQVLQQKVNAIESQILQALQQAALDIIEHLGMEAARRVILAERKAAVLERELSNAKQQALSMLLRLKCRTDAQILEAEKKYLMEKRRTQDAEAKLSAAQDATKRLKIELKRKDEALETLQKMVEPSIRSNLKSMEGLEIKQARCRGKSDECLPPKQSIDADDTDNSPTATLQHALHLKNVEPALQPHVTVTEETIRMCELELKERFANLVKSTERTKCNQDQFHSGIGNCLERGSISGEDEFENKDIDLLEGNLIADAGSTMKQLPSAIKESTGSAILSPLKDETELNKSDITDTLENLRSEHVSDQQITLLGSSTSQGVACENQRAVFRELHTVCQDLGEGVSYQILHDYGNSTACLPVEVMLEVVPKDEQNNTSMHVTASSDIISDENKKCEVKYEEKADIQASHHIPCLCEPSCVQKEAGIQSQENCDMLAQLHHHEPGNMSCKLHELQAPAGDFQISQKDRNSNPFQPMLGITVESAAKALSSTIEPKEDLQGSSQLVNGVCPESVACASQSEDMNTTKFACPDYDVANSLAELSAIATETGQDSVNVSDTGQESLARTRKLSLRKRNKSPQEGLDKPVPKENVAKRMRASKGQKKSSESPSKNMTVKSKDDASTSCKNGVAVESSRDNRRLMQGARQLFSLSEKKSW